MTALGYVHAQDRLQMELMRRIAPGRLSEIFGKVALKNDTFFALVLKRPQNTRLQI
jgi:penicillin amidase